MTIKQVKLVNTPRGELRKEDFKIEQVEEPKLKDDGILVRTLYLSVDPNMRPKMELTDSYTDKYETGEVLYGDGLAVVIGTKSSSFKEGDVIASPSLWWQEVAVYSDADIKSKNIHVANSRGLSLEENLYTLGMPGATAWVGMQKLGEPRKGSNVLISGAAGAVGSLAGQIAKNVRGCKVYGLAGSQEKCNLIKREFGFDQAINYKDDDLAKTLKREFPDGIDFFWDNVGGKTLDAVLGNMAVGGKIVMCGSISSYNNPVPISNYFTITAKRLNIQGFIVYDHLKDWDRAHEDLAKWVQEGKIKTHFTVHTGIDNMPEAMIGLLSGKNLGKMIVKIAPDVSAAR
jgi:NADPH-dependent curcumin reductase CurA